MGAWVNIGCGIWPAPAPWINLDVVRVPGACEPDIVVNDWRFPLDAIDTEAHGPIERVYLGHVLEHVPYTGVVPFLSRLRYSMMPGAELAAVGPDVFRSTDAMIAGTRDREWWWTNFEDDYDHPTGTVVDGWEGARHQWNCYEHRVVRLLTDAGYRDVTAHPNIAAFTDWPLVSHSPEQFAVTARTP
jgi:hypothetical protein